MPRTTGDAGKHTHPGKSRRGVSLSSGNPYAPLLLVSETAIVIFGLLRRPARRISLRPVDWALAVVATWAGLLIVPGSAPLPMLAPLGVALLVGGNLFQAWAKFSLRRSFGVAPANRGIKTSGPYGLLRHPMYAGYGAVHIGVLLLMFSPANLLIYIVGWCAQILRIHAEERLLSDDPGYRAYCEKVRWRLIPGLF
jgi:protein-S-isoprenylcysteine O-methyltransferase Ste14